MELLFWASFCAVFYAYFGYPLLLTLVGKIIGRESYRGHIAYAPNISVLIPVHNESSIIREKLENTLQLDYPLEKIEVLFISDGSTDGTNEIIHEFENEWIKLIEVEQRGGKANALNTGLNEANHDIIVFSDASIMLDKNALKALSKPFQDKEIGCVSGEDHIAEASGEGAYGRYELWLRNLESRIHSVVGASGSFYAQRKHLCKPFGEGLAPDFLSVLTTVESGFRAISEPRATGYMRSVSNPVDEFNRKIRTLIRGMTALFHKKNLMNIFRYRSFSLLLISHKLIRWLVPFFLILMLLSNVTILSNEFYTVIFFFQVMFYLLAALSFYNFFGIGRYLISKISLYFTLVNLSILIAWIKYWRGTRQEIWNPSVRN